MFVGPKAPFKLQEIWAIRVRLQMQDRLRDLAPFDRGIDSTLRACDRVKLRVRDVCHGDRLAARAMLLQQETQRPVQFEITPPTREALGAWIKSAGLTSDAFPLPSRAHSSPNLGTRQYARIVHSWVEEIGLDPMAHVTHSMRRTKSTLIYRRTKNLRAVQLLLDHTKLESTVRYLGIEVDDALEIVEQSAVSARQSGCDCRIRRSQTGHNPTSAITSRIASMQSRRTPERANLRWDVPNRELRVG